MVVYLPAYPPPLPPFPPKPVKSCRQHKAKKEIKKETRKGSNSEKFGQMNRTRQGKHRYDVHLSLEGRGWEIFSGSFLKNALASGQKNSSVALKAVMYMN